MEPRPLLDLVPTKYIFQPCSLAHSSEIIFSLISETTNTILSGGGVSEIVVRDNDNLPGQRREDLFERIFSEGGVVQNTCHFQTTATDRRVTDWF